MREEPWLIKKPLTVEGLIERYLDDVFGLGPLEEMLADETITEIMVNGSQSLYFEREGKLQKSVSSVWRRWAGLYAYRPYHWTFRGDGLMSHLLCG